MKEAENGQKGRKRHVSLRRQPIFLESCAGDSVDSSFFRKIVPATQSTAHFFAKLD